jgi:hypothetical protein
MRSTQMYRAGVSGFYLLRRPSLAGQTIAVIEAALGPSAIQPPAAPARS